MNDKHKAFVEEYLVNGHNATLAYQKAYPKVKYDTARANGTKLLANTSIQDSIQLKQKELADKASITKEELIRDLIYIKEISKDNQRSGNALKAIEIINKMLGFNLPTETNINMNLEQPLFSDDDLEPNE